MLSREELQEIKERTMKSKFNSLWENLWPVGSVYSDEHDNQRFLDLLEAAEHYAREDALKEGDLEELRKGDRVRVIRDDPSGCFLRKGQEAIVLNTRVWVSVMAPDNRCCVIDASFVEHIEPDSWEKLEEDATKGSYVYWECPSASCEDCRSRIEGKELKEFYGVDNCFKAKSLDLVARAKRLAEGGE